MSGEFGEHSVITRQAKHPDCRFSYSRYSPDSGTTSCELAYSSRRRPNPVIRFVVVWAILLRDVDIGGVMQRLVPLFITENR